MKVNGKRLRALVLFGLLLGASTAPSAHADWVAALSERVARIDAETAGELGVYIKRLGEPAVLDHQAQRAWYLASTIKVPVAIVLLQMVEAGELSLDEELELAATDYVDGAGDLIWQPPGGRYTLGTLLEKMIRNSDSTATDMLIRRIGEDELNRRIKASVAPEGFQPFTTILQVRYDAYGELHPSVRQLSNMDIIRLKTAAPGAERLRALLDRLPVDAKALQAPSIEAAFERYYQRGLNSGTLTAYGRMLERLVSGELLTPTHTRLLLDHMQNITTGSTRIQAGLPAGTDFAQKTGTQIARACNMGIIEPDTDAPVIVTACAEKFDSLRQAEAALARLGQALRDAALLD